MFSFVLELSDEVLSLLNESSPDFLEAFDTLVCFILVFTPLIVMQELKTGISFIYLPVYFILTVQKNIYIPKKLSARLLRKL